ncbi:MAG: CinA family protein [Candidatus Limnocylindria bacterium]
MARRRPPNDEELVEAARRLGDGLRRHGWQLASAESCTGGMIGHVVTQVPKSSDHYLGGIVSYSDAVKAELLGVDAELIERVGAVSPDVAEAMADGALSRFGAAELAIAVTGIAGPDGGTEQKPVGLTYVAVARRGGPARIERRVWEHDRDGNKRASTLLALELALDVAKG